ncbi:MAG: pyridoxamine 5'-phosphate oxidase family protein [Eubacterium sp.]|jgi:uncharacterized pyridoxamine 5'-phosphate oxidase family protein|nr:pyridoxamine 5'-phosphate oxidase family protein [Eubacterium sp.]MCI2197474.1 pyridoxamine 5'-phosphate oxidase family protein [Eubacterium sp.]
MTNSEKINQWLVECVEQSDAFFLNTIEDGKPKSRPISFHMLVDDTNYFGVGAMKEVYKQMQDNPWVEICGLLGHGKQFFRYYGKAVFEEDDRLSKLALEQPGYPVMKDMAAGEHSGRNVSAGHRRIRTDGQPRRTYHVYWTDRGCLCYPVGEQKLCI